MQAFKRVLKLTCVKVRLKTKETERLNSFKCLPNLSNLVLSDSLSKNIRKWSKWNQNGYFFQNHKNRPTAEGCAPDVRLWYDWVAPVCSALHPSEIFFKQKITFACIFGLGRGTLNFVWTNWDFERASVRLLFYSTILMDENRNLLICL